MRKIIKSVLLKLPIIGIYLKLRQCQYAGLSFLDYFKFRVFTRDKSIYWPKAETNIVANPKNIKVGKNCSIGSNGCYIQGGGKLIFGDNVRIATNVGIMSGNHDVKNHENKLEKVTNIGSYSWIGMNSIILPGVVLGQRTIVAAGAVVTKSFSDGFCVIGGNPAKLIKKFDGKDFVKPINKYEFYGYIPTNEFTKFSKKYLN